MKLKIFLFVTLFLISCQTTYIDYFSNCTWKKGNKIVTKQDAIDAAIKYMEFQEIEYNDFKDSVEVSDNLSDSTFYEVSFKYTDMYLPPNILFLVRKSDGCTVQAYMD